MSLPQLRVRTEFSFRTAYGRVEEVAARLAEIGCPIAGCVDTKGTWGHVRWEEATRATGVKPAYGAEVKIKEDVGAPAAWLLATDTRAFYRLMSSDPTTEAELAEARGVLRFAGSALVEPEAIDYVDLNPRSVTAAARSIELARRIGRPLVLTSDNDYPAPTDRERFLAWDDSSKMTPQHIVSDEELRASFWFLDDETFEEARLNTFEVAERLPDVSLPVAPIIHTDEPLAPLVEAGKRYRLAAGHIAEWTDEYEARLLREMEMIERKNYASYFVVVADLVVWAKRRMLVGPGRGSSAGSLVCYLLQITEVDPLPHGLLFERFIDINRDDLPDIDIDFNDQKRHLVFEYLAEKYGAENVARIGSVNTLKPRSVMAHVAKKMGIPHGATFNVTNVLIEYSSGDRRYGKGLEDTLTTTQPGRDFMERYPEAEVMGELEGHASHTGVHAAGIIVSNEPVVEFCTVRDGIAQLDKKDAEKLNLLKIDALGLRTLGVIEDAGCVDSETLFGLTLDDPEVFKIFDDQKFSGVFQFEGAAQRRVSMQIPIDSFRKIDHVTALARPGPLGGGAAQKYIERNRGDAKIEYKHPSMAEYLSATQGVVLYQEQVMRIVRELGGFSWEDTSVIRKAMSGRKGREFFDQQGEKFADGAEKKGIDRATAIDIWNEIVSFGAWGMNASHTTSYAVISYWCAYMKHHHPIEYAAACLRNAKDDEQVVEILRELRDEGVPYEPFDPELSDANWTAADGKLLGGYTNLVGIGPAKAAAFIQKRESTGLDEKDLEKLAKHKPKHQDLSPAHTMWGDIYRNPGNYNVRGRVKQIAELEDRENAVVVCRLVRSDRRDQNEDVRRQKRGGEWMPGQTLFLDCFVVDDSVTKPVIIRIKEPQWFSHGIKIADRAINGEEWFMVRGFWLKDFSMLLMKKMKCLTNTALFE